MKKIGEEEKARRALSEQEKDSVGLAGNLLLCGLFTGLLLLQERKAIGNGLENIMRTFFMR